MNVNERLSFADCQSEKHGLRGHVKIFTENQDTKETKLWFEDDNIIPISGYQWILMKMFGLYLDSEHKKNYENIGRDTTVVIPDLNCAGGPHQFGVDPNVYTPMTSDISENHFIQGFMIGNGGAGEDAITTKNTNYSFTKLRNPIPFQQTQLSSLPPSIAGKYLGMLRGTGTNLQSKSYYIKKFDERPHIYHSWWRDGQSWDYVDPVSQNDLGPNAVNGAGKTNRIETYCEVKMSLSADDCIAYFSHQGSTQTALVNELGLVAFDVIAGDRSMIENIYNMYVKELLTLIFDNNKNDEVDEKVVKLATDVHTGLTTIIGDNTNHTNINNFIGTLQTIINATDSIDYELIQKDLCNEENIGCEAFYKSNGDIAYTTDNFLTYMSDEQFSSLSTDEAQRIKLITYYTFNSIPLQSNLKIHINYRIYAN